MTRQRADRCKVTPTVSPVKTGAYSSKGRFKQSIGLSLVVAFVLVAIAPVAIVALSGLNQEEQQARIRVTDQLDSIADIKADQILEWLDENQTILNLFLASSTQYTNVLQSLQPGTQQTASNQVLTRFLAEESPAQHNFTEFFVYDLNGQILVSTTPRQVGKIVTAQPYYKPSLNSAYVQPPYYEVGQGELNMIVSQPVINGDGAVIGVLAGRANLSSLSEIMLARGGLGETGETYLVSLENSYLVTASRFPGYPLAQTYHSNAIDNALAGKDGGGTYPDYRKTMVIGVYQWLPNLQVGLIAEINEAEVLGSLIQARNFSVEVAAVAALGAALLGIAIAVWLTRPILLLTHTAIAIADGDYNQRVAITRHNEIGQLAATFNSMTERLVQVIHELSGRMEEVARGKEALTQANERLQQALEHEQDLNELKSRFVGMVSHEYRSPLTSILSAVGILRRYENKITEVEKVAIFQKVEISVHRMTQMLDDVLGYNKFEEKTSEIALVPVNATVFCQATMENARTDLRACQTFIFSSKDSECEFEVDTEMFGRALFNILANAVKYSPLDSTISVELDGQSEQICIRIRDEGMGIPPAEQIHVAEPFYRAQNVENIAGTGLGLAMSKNAIERHGGTLTFESVLDKGTTFTATLPRLARQL